MIDALAAVLRADPRIGYALIFGSAAKGTMHANSDVDVAIAGTVPLSLLDLGALAARLEQAVGIPVDLVVLDEAPPGLAYRIFRDGVVILARDATALGARRARAILEYLDFRPIEDLCTKAVLGVPDGR
jgi:predicted nucleotidyltransferase